ncbi:hypothetical protein J6590_059079 [Homalodisca vitripennis]|nr:hypothetical protein J6590_059079 [Homalodisca vitripennis]
MDCWVTGLALSVQCLEAAYIVHINTNFSWRHGKNLLCVKKTLDVACIAKKTLTLLVFAKKTLTLLVFAKKCLTLLVFAKKTLDPARIRQENSWDVVRIREENS